MKKKSQNPTRRRRKLYLNRFTEYQLFSAILLGIVLLLNILIWCSEAFCDWYSRYCFPVFLNTYGRFTSLFPFSVGEVMICLAILLAVFAAFAWIPIVRFKRNHGNKKVALGLIRFYKVLLVLVLNVLLVMTLNCFALYHCSALDPNPEREAGEYTTDDLLALREYVVTKANALAESLPRNDLGYLTYDGDLQETCEEALRNLSDDYPKLDGWYPTVKGLHFSNFVSQMYICGYYFPFSLEANVNTNMYIANNPECYCHELAHTRGYIYENEANFISYLACVSSDDPFLQYSGYLSVMNYIDNDLYEVYPDKIPGTAWNSHIYMTDMAFLQPGKWEEIEENALISTETVDAVSDKITDTSLKVNGVTSGIISYSEVVELLLEHYDGVLY